MSGLGFSAGRGGVKFGRMVAGSHWCNINVWEGSIGNRLIRCSTVQLHLDDQGTMWYKGSGI